jgi:exodeoxyribonuclease VII small subunit
MAKKQITYNEAITEIQQILEEVETEKIDIDLLSEKIKRATELIEVCKNKLKKTDEEIEALLKSVDK